MLGWSNGRSSRIAIACRQCGADCELDSHFHRCLTAEQVEIQKRWIEFELQKNESQSHVEAEAEAGDVPVIKVLGAAHCLNCCNPTSTSTEELESETRRNHTSTYVVHEKMKN